MDIKEILNQRIRNNSISFQNCSCVHDTFTGTPHFMSPEILKGEKYGRGVDIWALGCTVIEMFTGKPPWYDLKTYDFFYQMAFKKLPEYQSFEASSEAKDFLKKAMDESYEKRCTANELLYHSFILFGNEKDE